MKPLSKALKVTGGIVGVVAALELLAVAAWAAGAPTALLIPLWAAAVAAAAVIARGHRGWLRRLRREAG